MSEGKKVPKENPLSKGRGRPAGVPNKTTTDFRDAVNKLLNKSAPHMIGWMEQVAHGDIENGIKPDPGRALDLMGKLAEYVAPKLARVEHAGDKENPVHLNVNLSPAEAYKRLING